MELKPFIKMKIQKITSSTGQVVPQGVENTQKTTQRLKITEKHHIYRDANKEVSYWSQKIPINGIVVFCISLFFIISIIYVMS